MHLHIDISCHNLNVMYKMIVVKGVERKRLSLLQKKTTRERGYMHSYSWMEKMYM